MVYQKVFGALKSMNNSASDVFGRIKVGVQKYAPDVLEHGTALASMIPGAHQPFAAAANLGIRALRGKIEEVPNKEVAQKLSSAVKENTPVIGILVMERYFMRVIERVVIKLYLALQQQYRQH